MRQGPPLPPEAYTSLADGPGGGLSISVGIFSAFALLH